jgi:molybdopterin-binding protein
LEKSESVSVASGVEIVAAITTSSVERLGLAVGKEAQVVIKATSVMLNAWANSD